MIWSSRHGGRLSGSLSTLNIRPKASKQLACGFQKPIAQRSKEVSSDPWPTNPIDSFLHSTHVAHSVQTVPPAAKSALLRRVSLDLIGLPPTADDLARFEADRSPDAYERLLLDCMLGDPTLFAREDEVEEAWRFCTAILDGWRAHPPDRTHSPNYAAGTWGPEEAQAFMARDGRAWHIP